MGIYRYFIPNMAIYLGRYYLNPHWTESPPEFDVSVGIQDSAVGIHYSGQWGFRAPRNQTYVLRIGSRPLTLLAVRAYIGGLLGLIGFN